MQALLPGAEEKPAGHGRHEVVPPLEKVPARHALHVREPYVLEYRPGGHGSHASSPSLSEKDPGPLRRYYRGGRGLLVDL